LANDDKQLNAASWAGHRCVDERLDSCKIQLYHNRQSTQNQPASYLYLLGYSNSLTRDESVLWQFHVSGNNKTYFGLNLQFSKQFGANVHKYVHVKCSVISKF